MNSSPLGPDIELKQAKRLLEELGITAIVITTGEAIGFPRGGISSVLDHRWYSPPPSMRAVAPLILSLQMKRAADANRVLFDETHYRLSGLSLAHGHVELRLEYCTYFDFVSTNLSLDLIMSEVCPDWGDDRLRDRLSFSPTELREDPLCNQLGISLSIVTKPDNRLLFSRRGPTVFAYPNGYANAVNGEVDVKDIQEGEVSLSRTAVREANEELGIEIGSDDIDFLGLCRSPVTLQPILIGVAFTDMSAPQAIERAKSARDRFEHEEILDIEFKPSTVVQHVRNAGAEWIPQCAACCIFSVLKSHGLAAVLDCLPPGLTL